MVEGELLNAKMEHGKFLFAFATESGTVYDNYEISKNYEIRIDNELKEPELTYEEPYVIVKNFKGEEIDRYPRYKEGSTLDSNRKIVISMNEEMYYDIFGKLSNSYRTSEISKKD